MEIIPLETVNPDARKIGRPPINPSANQRADVAKLACFGIRQRHIASLLNIDPKSLRKYFRQELDAGVAVGNKEVLHSLFEMATSRRHAAATIFWAKTRGGFTQKDRKPPKESAVSQSSPASQPVRRSSLEGLTVTLDDGAPNGQF